MQGVTNTSQEIEKDLEVTVIDIESQIQRICALQDDACEANARVGGVSLDILKSVAVALNLNKTQSKKQLIQAIKSKVRNRDALELLKKQDLEKEYGGTFRKDKTLSVVYVTS